MNHLIWPASLAGLVSTAVIFGTDMFFLTVGRPALRLASQSAATEVMGFVHLFGDRRMPIWGILAILSNLLLVLFGTSGHRTFYLLSLSMLILLRGYLQPFLQANQSAPSRSGEKRGKIGQCSCAAGVLGPLSDDARAAAVRIHARSVCCLASHFFVRRLLTG
jgi:hypothetical protein